MPTLKNPRHEKFAQLVASGIAANAAFAQVGYKAPQNSPRLRNNELVAKRIEELQVRNERKAKMTALTRNELVSHRDCPGNPRPLVRGSHRRRTQSC
jgi:phage terminase small subunit